MLQRQAAEANWKQQDSGSSASAGPEAGDSGSHASAAGKDNDGGGPASVKVNFGASAFLNIGEVINREVVEHDWRKTQVMKPQEPKCMG